MADIKIKTVSSLEKILPKSECDAPALTSVSALVGEEICYQVAYKSAGGIEQLSVRVTGDLSECVKLYSVIPVSVKTPHFPGLYDELYITHTPALIPDILRPIGEGVFAGEFYSSVWVSVKVRDLSLSGKHTVGVSFFAGEEEVAKSEVELNVIPAELPPLDTPLTQWFYCDCIANYHGCEVFSDRFWKLVENYMSVAAEHGQNMILTPVFTPPLDTAVGRERRTVQLVDVEWHSGEWHFGFEKLFKWLDTAKRVGMKYIEISHLFTQWGAEHAPKIEAVIDGVRVKKFGWETDSLGEEYLAFLDAFLPKLTEALVSAWDPERIYFHISDEPGVAHLERYGKIYEFMAPRLSAFHKMDALSSYEFYQRGFVKTPVVATSHIESFLDKNVEDLWCYYCCSQGRNKLSNRFIAMPSFRTRIIGMQMYANNIKGFLQWGYNFYNGRLSLWPIDPYATCDADGGFPAGDAFVVYPTADGCTPSLRLKVFASAIADLRAARLLESLTSREYVTDIIDSYGKMSFTEYPESADALINMRERINKEIEKALNGDR